MITPDVILAAVLALVSLGLSLATIVTIAMGNQETYRRKDNGR